MRNLAMTLLILLLPHAAGAIEFVYHAEGGPDYFEADLTGGVTLRSLTPETHHVGAAGLEVTGIETIRLNPDCSARSGLLGEGGWRRDRGGFVAVFEGASVSFPEQGPPPELGEGC